MDDEADPAARGEHPHRLWQRFRKIGIFDAILAGHRVEAAIGERQRFHIDAAAEIDRGIERRMAADEGRRIDRGPIDRDDRARAAVRGGDQRDGAVAGAQIEDAGAPPQIGEEGAPAGGDIVVIIGRARPVEARGDAVIMPILVPDAPVRQASPLPPFGT